MARGIKLPEELKDWKITSLVSEKKGQNKYRIVKKTAAARFSLTCSIFLHTVITTAMRKPIF